MSRSPIVVLQWGSRAGRHETARTESGGAWHATKGSNEVELTMEIAITCQEYRKWKIKNLYGRYVRQIRRVLSPRVGHEIIVPLKQKRLNTKIHCTHHKHCKELYPRDRASKEDFLPCGSSYMVHEQESEYSSSLTAQASCFPLGLGWITSVILLPHDYE